MINEQVVLIAIYATKIVRMKQQSYMCVAMSPCYFEFCTDKIMKKTPFPFMLNEETVEKKVHLFRAYLSFILERFTT